MTFVTGSDPGPEDEAQSQDITPSPAESQTTGVQPDTSPSMPDVPPVLHSSQPYMQAIDRPQQRGRGGCVLAAVGTLILVAILVGVALVLPPFSLLDQLTGPQYTALDANNISLSHPDGLVLEIDAEQPGDGFAAALDSVPQADFDGTVPGGLTLKSPIYEIAYTGTLPGVIGLNIAVPNDAEPYDTLDLYGWDAENEQWAFIPSQLRDDLSQIVTTLDYVPDRVALFQTNAAIPSVVVPVNPAETFSPQVAAVTDILMPSGLRPTIQGTLDGGLPGNFQTGAGYNVFLTINNYRDPNQLDVSTIETILGNEALLQTHISELVACAANCYQGGVPVDGIAIDYQGLDAEYRDQFSQLIRELARNLRVNGKSLIVVVPAAEEIVGQPWNTGAYDWRAIGRYADRVEITLGNNPIDFVPGGLVERMLRWGVGEISRYKIQVSISALSFRQVGVADPSFVSIGFEEAISALGNVEILTESDLHYFVPGTTIEAALNGYTATTGVDSEAHTPYIEFADSAGRIWLATRDALLYRMSILRPFNIGGVALRDLLSLNVSPEALQAASAYQLNETAAADETVELALQWTVLSASGAIVAEGTTAIDEPFQWEAVEQDGNYAVNVVVISGGQESDRAGQQVAVAFPTNTPLPPTATPIPTDTPTTTPTTPPPTAVPQVAQPTQTPAQDQGAAPQPTQAPAANPPPVVSGSIGGSFEIGGHVANMGSPAPELMRSAGMTWVKHQVRFGLGGDPGGVAGQIQEAHAMGFRVLLGVVGNPGELGSTPEDQYFADYARYVGGLAALGADAIEVWNEMNIDREWPTGQIDPAMYTRLLAAAYNAIKASNGSTMVISGALAPTGAEGAFGRDRVWNDDGYYAGMAAAGAVQYMDCVGAHYNEGIVPPDQVGNDPRGDSYPTRFLTTMTDRAWGPFGGQRPVCYTELGYLTPEGYGPLAAGFEWAANVTVAQQAAWLANAAVINSNSGKVRLMIIWNVNFSNYEGDPMAGYAMIRPGGGCPACTTLGQVTP